MSRPRRRTQVFQWIQISVLKNGLAEAFHKGLITPEGTHINVCDFRGGYLASRDILEAGRAAGSRWRCKRPGDQFMIAEIFPGNVSLPDRVLRRRNLNDSVSATEIMQRLLPYIRVHGFLLVESLSQEQSAVKAGKGTTLIRSNSPTQLARRSGTPSVFSTGGRCWQCGRV
jgi:hypothetical protein